MTSDAVITWEGEAGLSLLSVVIVVTRPSARAR